MKTAHDMVAAAKARVQEVTVDRAEEAIREADEYAVGHVPGAVLIPRGLLEFRMSNTPAMESRGLNIVLYCKTSGRAALAACALQDMGYLNVRSIAGGFDAWQQAGKPVAKPELPAFD